MKTYIAEGISLNLNSERCVGCGLCKTVCPQRVFGMEGVKARIVHLDCCIECGACQSNCPVDAIVVKSGTGCAMLFKI